MLKKIVKYGNSSAIVLDKAILEILNIAEGSIVKLKTDGTSLIITPQEESTNQEVNTPYTYAQSHQDAVIAELLKHYRKTGNAKVDAQVAALITQKHTLEKKLAHHPELAQTIKSESAIINANKKYALLSSDEKQILAYTNAKNALIPDLASLEKELKSLENEYNLLAPVPQSSEQKLTAEMTALHKKYAAAIHSLSTAMELPEYIHESQLLAEKFKGDTHSADFIHSSQQLTVQFVPEMANYYKEMQDILNTYQK